MNMKTLIMIACCGVASALAPFSYANDIVTSTPVTYMLSQQLLKGTDIDVSYLPPKRYGIERLTNWFANKGQQHVVEAGKRATVAITLRAIWPQDPTYVYARQGNIHLIEIDASQAISPRAQGVAALTLEQGEISKYVWMNPTNLIRMAAIVGDDLQKVYPQHQATIDTNQQALLLAMRTLMNQQQAAIFARQMDSVVLLSQALEDFAVGNQLFVVERQFKPQLEWTESDKQKLKDRFEQDPTLWLVTDKRLSTELTSLVPSERILQVDVIDRWGSQGISVQAPLARWQL